MKHIQDYVVLTPRLRYSNRGQRKCSSPPRLETIFEEDNIDVDLFKGVVCVVPLFISLFTFYYLSKDMFTIV
ncbi:hypothetical protein BVRB_7g179080 [Beta vulgaris subsp. vulgaris]|uniref:Uncharacterized protein n=1 Tax=Beta vulgaris subsp. vulgaris TaxID=3555 RepID=A0A0J8BAS9_BETVV|nr:hypothetical protein BVRB_7g179080 [Beta vulgaris subsp. vulgaris]